MSFVPFEMERYQSTWEHEVQLNLSESGVHPATLDELLRLTSVTYEELGAIELEYIQSNGSAELRERIAAFHPGASGAGIVVTNGSAEANFLAAWELCRPGDEIVFMAPNYFQIQGLAENFGATVRSWWLRDRDGAWQADLDELDTLVNERTRAIIVTSPNNPTGARFGADFIARVVEAAARVGAWIVADEVYRGAELDGVESPTFHGKYDRLIVTGGLSKAYGLPGLRIGWAVSDEKTAARLWSRKDYTTISPGAINEFLAARALTPERRMSLLDRTRSILRHNWPILEAWLQERSAQFEWVPPDAGAIVLARYASGPDSMELAERVRREVGCLLVPGEHFGLARTLRIGFGPPPERLSDGLDRLSRVVDTLSLSASAARA